MFEYEIKLSGGAIELVSTQMTKCINLWHTKAGTSVRQTGVVVY